MDQIKVFQIMLRAIGAGVFVVASMHLLFGPGSEVMLGSAISANSLTDPVIDSQNRFYGVAFALYGGIFILASTDVVKYQQVLLLAFAIFFLAGLARIASIMVTDWPPPTVIGLSLIEIIGPPLMIMWLLKVVKKSQD